MSRKGQSITLSISDRDKAALEALAEQFGMNWGENPNISKLVKAIAKREILLAPNHDWKEPRIQALKQAMDALIDAGDIQIALEIARILLERSELPIPLRNEIARFVDNPSHPRRLEIERYIQRQQPFQLTYQDAAERIWHFHIYYAIATRHEDRQYLDCWCEETEGNLDISELQHNWSLRLDRIAEAAIVAPIKGKWRNLDYIEVEMHLLRNLAFAYRSKTTQDMANELLPDSPPIRRVVRKVTNTFWFIREVLRYGKDCIIVSPESVRDKLREEARLMYQQYESP